MARLDSSGDTLFLDESLPSCDSLSNRETIRTPPSSGMGSTHSLPSGPRHSSTDITSLRRGHGGDKPHIYEDVGSSGPPKITPISGVLSKGKVAIRPIAFKPVLPSCTRYTSLPSVSVGTPVSCLSVASLRQRSSNGGANSPYLSESELKSSTATLSRYNSFLLDVDAYSTDSCIKLSETPAYLSSQGSVLHLDDFAQTPSPSDSGVAELEAMLKEKDSEINYLRETMEQNEQVIFKVYEEKEHSWQREVKRLKAQYEGKLKACHQRALKMEQMLMMQTYQLQQDKRKLRQDCEESKREKESAEQQTEELRQELDAVRAQLEETEWTMCQKSGEISLLKSQLKDSQGDQSNRATEMVQLKAQLREARADCERKDMEVRELRDQVSSLRQEAEEKRHRAEKDLAGELNHRMDRLLAETDATKQRLLAQQETFEDERVRWFEEKEKVILYQKQLQLNYVQMYRRNRTLESEVEQLTLELEGRDLKIINGESHC